MTELDPPLTRREFFEFRADLDARRDAFTTAFATKRELHAGLQAVRSETAEGFANMWEFVETSVDKVRDDLRSAEERLRRARGSRLRLYHVKP